MGRSAQIESLKRQLAAKDTELRQERAEHEACRARLELVGDIAESLKAENQQYEQVSAIMEPVVTAAIDLTELHDPCQWDASLKTNDLKMVDATKYGALLDALVAAEKYTRRMLGEKVD